MRDHPGYSPFHVTDAQWDAVVTLAGGWPCGDAEVSSAREIALAVRDMSGSRTANPFRIFRIFRIFREAGDHHRRGLAGRSGRARLPSMRSVDPIGDRVPILPLPATAEGGEVEPCSRPAV